MENSYGIGVANRYSLFLDEEEDPLEVLKRQEQEREIKRKSKVLGKELKAKNAEPRTIPIRKAAKETLNAKVSSTKPTDTTKSKYEIANTKAVHQKNVKFLGDSQEVQNDKRNFDEKQTRSDSIRDGPREGQGRGPRSDQTTGTRDGPREGFGRGFRDISGLREGLTRGPRNMTTGLRDGQTRGPRNDMTSGLRDGQTRGPRNDVIGEDRRGRGMGPRGNAARGRSYRGIPGNRASYDIRDKRDFDRPFGSTDKTELQLATEAPSNEWVAEPPAPIEVVAGEAIIAPAVTEAVAEDPIPAEEEPHELTLDEYKALRGSRQKPTYNLRKAGEGEDLTQWNNMYELSRKKEEEEPDEEEATEYDVLEYPQRVGRQKHLLNIDIHFADGRRGSRGRGGRGGSRGSRGSGPRGGAGGAGPRSDDSTRVARGRGDYLARGRGDYQGPAFRGERGIRFMNERGVLPERGDHSESRGSRVPIQSAPKVDDEHDFPSLG